MKKKLFSLIEDLEEEGQSRLEAGERSSELYIRWSRPSWFWRWLGPPRWYWELNRALNLYDYSTKNTPPGGPKWYHHLIAFFERMFSGIEWQPEKARILNKIWRDDH